jgi:hypothetical protein
MIELVFTFGVRLILLNKWLLFDVKVRSIVVFFSKLKRAVRIVLTRPFLIEVVKLGFLIGGLFCLFRRSGLLLLSALNLS